MDFLIERFGASRAFAAFRDDFAISEDRWWSARVDALLMCIISFLYMSIYADHLDVGVVMVMRALREDQTILPLILAKTFISASYCWIFGDREFRGSSVLLYVWFMTHLQPIGIFRPYGFCFGHNIASRFSFRSSSCTDPASWMTFLESVGEPFSILVYSGYCSLFSVIIHTADLDFLPLTGLRGVTTYHPLAVMGQFSQGQDLHLYEGAAEYRFPITLSIEVDLARVYGL